MDILSEVEQMPLRWGRPDGVIVSRSSVVAEARNWLGTPWIHQQETHGLGADCGGIVRGVSVALGLIPHDYKNQVPLNLRGYSRQPSGNLGVRICDFFWRRIKTSEMQPGDVILMRFSRYPQHSAILGDYKNGGLSMIHSLSNKGVVEHSLDEQWRKRIVAAYALPGVE